MENEGKRPEEETKTEKRKKQETAEEVTNKRVKAARGRSEKAGNEGKTEFF